MTPRRYAEQTTVAESHTRAQLERLLQQYGATAFGYGWVEDGGTILSFRLAGRFVQMLIPMPNRADPLICETPSGKARTESQIEDNYAQEVRRRWRALFAVVKAKLVAVSEGISTIEREFLADIVLPDGRTLSQWIAPQLEDAYEKGSMPTPLLALPEGS